MAVAMLLLVSQGALLDVVAMPGGRPKGSKTLLGRTALVRKVERISDEK